MSLLFLVSSVMWCWCGVAEHSVSDPVLPQWILPRECDEGSCRSQGLSKAILRHVVVWRVRCCRSSWILRLQATAWFHVCDCDLKSGQPRVLFAWAMACVGKEACTCADSFACCVAGCIDLRFVEVVSSLALSALLGSEGLSAK